MCIRDSQEILADPDFTIVYFMDHFSKSRKPVAGFLIKKRYKLCFLRLETCQCCNGGPRSFYRTFFNHISQQHQRNNRCRSFEEEVIIVLQNKSSDDAVY